LKPKKRLLGRERKVGDIQRIACKKTMNHECQCPGCGGSRTNWIIIKTRDLIRVTVKKLDQKASNNLQIWMATMKSWDRSLIHQIHQIHQTLIIDPSLTIE